MVGKKRIIVGVAMICLLAACSNVTRPWVAETPAPTATAVDPGGQDASDLTPMPPQAEEHLEGELVGIPEVYVVPASQPISVLASYLKTDPEQLQRVNGPLADPLLPGTVVLIPNSFLTEAGATLSSVAEATGIPEAQLRAANPEIDDSLETPTLVLLPRLYIIQNEVDIVGLADSLRTDTETLLSANPSLADLELIQPGTVLIAPVEGVQP